MKKENRCIRAGSKVRQDRSHLKRCHCPPPVSCAPLLHHTLWDSSMPWPFCSFSGGVRTKRGNSEQDGWARAKHVHDWHCIRSANAALRALHLLLCLALWNLRTLCDSQHFRRCSELDSGWSDNASCVCSLLCLLFYEHSLPAILRTLSHHPYVVLLVSVNPEADAYARRNANAREDGNARRRCWIKIDSREALTVKHPKPPSLVPRSSHCFPNSLPTLVHLTPALSRSLWKPRPISAFLTFAHTIITSHHFWAE